jgi:hypothetical protein
MEKQLYEVPQTRVVTIAFEHVLMNPSDQQLPPSDEFEGGDY